MFSVETTAAFFHPPDDVFAALSALDSALRWQAGVRGIRRRGRRAPGGGPVVLHYRALGAGHLLVARVTACDPPRHFAYRAEGAAFTLDAAYAVEAAPGGARVTLRVALTAATSADPTPAALRRLLGRRVPADLARLGRWVSARAEAAR